MKKSVTDSIKGVTIVAENCGGWAAVTNGRTIMMVGLCSSLRFWRFGVRMGGHVEFVDEVKSGEAALLAAAKPGEPPLGSYTPPILNCPYFYADMNRWLLFMVMRRLLRCLPTTPRCIVLLWHLDRSSWQFVSAL